MLVNGVIDLVLAGIVIFELPGRLVWALGRLGGINLVFGGSTRVAMAMDARETAFR